MAHIEPYRGILPRIGEHAYVAPTAAIIGDVEIAPYASVWHGAVIRGDVQPIQIGRGTSIQDNCVVHATKGWTPTIIGEDCTIGHSAVLHGCHLHARVLVGMGAVLLDYVEVEPDVLIAAGSVVPLRTKIPAGSLVVGQPAKVARALRPDEIARIAASAKDYFCYRAEYLGEVT